ncbi:MAG TPA: fatty acid desaturase [Flavobacteriales bacterium]|nr:fatty acid desaturase [Flavobacteriales bacterium]HRE95552.1 fatty acid desaturase [Flavobacteriales bacterium]HRJ35968.1 fatty acid desaturase [Flavobacteriales bacterium]HRJ39193.1 fatty acid desaturase [Flavobacteriales bacterium]
MRTGKELILATKPFTKESKGLSWYYTISTLILLCGSIVTALLIEETIVRTLASLFAGLVMVRFFVIYHDHQHGAILSKSSVATIVFKLFGVLILAPSSIWKRSHDYHHNHNSKLFSASIGSYPIMTREKFLKSTPSEKRSYLATRHPLTIFFGYFSMFLVGMCVQSFSSSPKRHWDSLVALILHFSLQFIVFYFLGWEAWLFGIIIPFILADMIGAYLFYAQHNFPGVTFREKEGWTYHHAALESSSYMKMNFFWNWVTANIGYHHIHHMNSRIPFYRLPEVMKSIPELQNARETSLSIKDIVACFRLKVWDPERNKMISLKEI